jgi:lysophospholipase L1-like esterase
MESVASRQQLLIFGDSISQGFVAGNPALSWPSLLAKKLGFDVVNQGIGGQVFQPTTLLGLAGTIEPAAIIVEFGANYRYERCSRQEVARDVRIYLEELSQLWAGVPCWVLTPLWHNENVWPTNPASCFSDVPAMIAESTKAHPAMHLVEGTDLLDSDSAFFADGFEHPNAAGSEQIAARLAKIMKPALAGEHDI